MLNQTIMVVNQTALQKCTSKTLLLPFVNEDDWNINVRIILYLVALLWSFTGVAIGADLFMCAIEKITSKTKIIKVAVQDDDPSNVKVKDVEIHVWNSTVANLSLMALGSSAPEILLSVIEVVGNNFESGELGPGTIVGSAAFNLLVIIGVSIMVIPDGETRRINSFAVFLTTSFFAVFAYIWLFICMSVWSPNEITIPEAVVTLLLFFVLVGVAYVADRKFFGLFKSWKRDKEDEERVQLCNLDLLDEELVRKEYPEFIDYMKEIAGNPNLNDEESAKLIAIKINQSKTKSYAQYRVGALRKIGGGRKVEHSAEDVIQKKQGVKLNATGGVEIYESIGSVDADHAKVEFVAAAVSVLENAKIVKVLVSRKYCLNESFDVRFETVDGSATAGDDYISKRDILHFGANETEKAIDVEIIDDYEWEPNETFFVKLYIDPKDGSKNVKLGDHSVCEVTIVNDDDPGTFVFDKPSHIVKESCGTARITVERKDGADGQVELSYVTRDGKAVHGKDYIGSPDGNVLVFCHGETVKEIEVEIMDDHTFEKDETFIIELTGTSPAGAVLGPMKRTVVTIMNDDEYRNTFDRIVNMANFNEHMFTLGAETWGQQFSEALNVNGGDIENATATDYIMHIVTFGWKLIFACAPPVKWGGGWLAFTVLIMMIGMLTAIIGDLATIFGCCVNLKPEVTAITFVALGTSLPDLFASKTAAIKEKYADACIGNVTGSNGVNVFLGLGIPWMIASIYHKVNGTTFKTATGSLTTSVVTYAVCAILCILLVITRRFVGSKAELGGGKLSKIICGGFLVMLWLIYVLVSANVAYGNIAQI